MVLMSVRAWSQPGSYNWNLTSTFRLAGRAMLTPMCPRSGSVGDSWVTWASGPIRASTRAASSSNSVLGTSDIGMFDLVGLLSSRDDLQAYVDTTGKWSARWSGV